MENLDLLIKIAKWVLLYLLIILNYKVCSHMFDFLNRIKGLIIYQKCRKNKTLHQEDNPYYQWRRKYLIMEGRNPKELTFDEYESHFIDGDFYGE